jgi:CheY-like chemotaxis protein
VAWLRKKLKILVVEDDPDISRIISSTLDRAGFDVVIAFGGADAIRKLTRHRFALVLTDLAMPEVTGVEVIQQLRAATATRNIPVIAVTAHTWDRIAQAANEVGCDGYVSKPFTPKQLLEAIGRHLGLSPSEMGLTR